MLATRPLILAAAAALLTLSHARASVTATFDDLPLAPESYYNGSDEAGGFTSAGIHLSNSYNTAWSSWSGFSLSNTTDTTTAGFGNQYSAFAGSGAGAGNDNYAVAYNSGVITLPVATTVQSVQITNTTYAALSMLQGDSFAKQFGGLTGDDPDFFKLTLIGKDTAGSVTGNVDFYLADYRFADNAQDYIVDTWQLLDLTSLGSAVRTIEFAFASSDNGEWGMNTPATFALDNLTVAHTPEPGTLALLGIAGVALLRRKRRAVN